MQQQPEQQAIGTSLEGNAPGGVPRKYCLQRDKPDSRDIKFQVPHDRDLVTVPRSYDLSPQMPPTLDQGSLGSCTANAAANALRYLLRKEKEQDFLPSRLYQYYATRVYIEGGDPNQDTGCQMRDVCIALSKYHALPEVFWPYVIEKFNMKPPALVAHEAAKHPIIEYRAVPQDEYSMKYVLSQGFPILVGIQVYAGLESEDVARTGVGQMPKKDEQLLGGHAIQCVGYDEAGWTLQNSWGTSYGRNGFFTLPKAYLLDQNLAGDFWALTKFM